MKGLEGKAHRPLSGAQFLKNGLIAAVFCLMAGTLVLSTPFVARLMYDDLETYPPLAPATLPKAAAGAPMAIVILSAGMRELADEFGDEFHNQALDGFSLERVRYGAFVAHKTGLPILVTGGDPYPGGISLAQLMALTLETDYGVRPQFVESQSTNTAENAILSAEILKRAGIGRVMLVTHAWHMKRAVAAFEANGLSVTAAPTSFYYPARSGVIDGLSPNFGTLRMSLYAVHEIIGRIWYRVRYGY